MRRARLLWLLVGCLAVLAVGRFLLPFSPSVPGRTPPSIDYAQYKERWLTPPKTPSPLLAHKSYRSKCMDTEVGYHLYLPPGYDAPENREKRYPVIYWLHGLNQSESSTWFPADVHALLDELKIPHTYGEVKDAEHNLPELVAVTGDSTLKFAAEHFTGDR